MALIPDQQPSSTSATDLPKDLVPVSGLTDIVSPATLAMTNALAEGSAAAAVLEAARGATEMHGLFSRATLDAMQRIQDGPMASILAASQGFGAMHSALRSPLFEAIHGIADSNTAQILAASQEFGKSFSALNSPAFAAIRDITEGPMAGILAASRDFGQMQSVFDSSALPAMRAVSEDSKMAGILAASRSFEGMQHILAPKYDPSWMTDFDLPDHAHITRAFDESTRTRARREARLDSIDRSLKELVASMKEEPAKAEPAPPPDEYKSSPEFI